MKQKILGIFLSLSLMLSVLPGAALAEENEAAEENNAAETTAEKTTPAAAEGDTTVTIFTTNDIHGVVEYSEETMIGLAQVAAIKASTENALLIDAGDATQGASFATVSQGEDVIRMMNAAGYDAMAAGNHEFDYGTERLLANAEAAEFPILSANVTLEGETLLEASAVVEEGGKAIGLIGLTTVSTATSTNPAQLTGVAFADEVEAAKEQIAALKEAGDVDAIVLICHLGDNASAVSCTSAALLDALTEEELASVAAVIDGHSHTVEDTDYVRGDISLPVVQTGTGLSALGQITLTFSEDGACSADGQVLDYAAAMAYPLTEAGTAAAESTSAVLEEIKAGQGTLLDELLCTTVSPLWGGYVYYDYVESRIVETAYGDFITDAFCASAQQFAENAGLLLPVVAVENGGGIGQTMPMGEVTRGDILDAFNHGNMVVVLSVTPAQLYTALEQGLTMTGQDETGLLVRERVSGSFLQAGGFTYAYDPAADAGAKVTEIQLDDGSILARDDAETRLLLATNNYVATFAGLSEGEKLGELGGEDLIVENYIREMTEDGTVSLEYPMTQGRIRIANDQSPELYTVSLPITSEGDKLPMADAVVHLSIDGGDYTEMTADENGTVVLELAKGPHTFLLEEAPEQAVYVNNYSGSGTVTTADGYYHLGFTVENPAAEASRAMAVVSLWEAAGSPEAEESGFTDRETFDASYASAVDWAASVDVVVGFEDGSFGPALPVTREQMCVILYRWAFSEAEEGVDMGMVIIPISTLDAGDAYEVSEWAYEAVCWCVSAGILTLTDDGLVLPQETLTQAELAQMLTVYAGE